ncbi:MAG: cytidylate kinase-like family protein [Tannerellaceae bacterium]|jgi:cytidylate kinase|nr:cytidylate kinase-like family protein [Tannerellaceae bacterium]
MGNPFILTIGRQFGSGGRIIGKKLADTLGISFYDNELITLAAKESGLCPEVFERADEKASSGLAHACNAGLSYVSLYAPYADILSNEGLFKIQSDAIRKLSLRESCVIVGRCADYILRDDPRCISLFIHDKMANRVRRVASRQQLAAEQARELIARTDKSRAAYYDYFTNKTWGLAASYNFSIDVSVLGIDPTVDFIKNMLERIRPFPASFL